METTGEQILIMVQLAEDQKKPQLALNILKDAFRQALDQIAAYESTIAELKAAAEKNDAV